MRYVRKTSFIFNSKSGESMVEVMVAFVVLSIILLIFAEGLQMATRLEVRSDQTRRGADSAMADVQSRISSGETFGSRMDEISISSDGVNSSVVPYTYQVNIDGNDYTFVVYKAG